MASTVTANNLAVATSTSSHIAATIADVRLVDNKVPTPLPNYIESEHIARHFCGTVVFDDGKVWSEPVEVGDAPKSKPVDNWIGVKGGKKNSFACAAPGAGSPNVFVGGKKVLCFSHRTEQNAHNSFGVITDKAGLDALLKEYEESLKKNKAKADADGTSKGKGGGSGAGGQGTSTPPVAKPPAKDPEPATDCTVTGVKLLDNHPKGTKRKPSPPDAGAAPATIEVLQDSNIELEAIVGNMCGEHPVWECQKAGWTAKGPKATFKVPGRVASSGTGGAKPGALGIYLAFVDLPSLKPDEYAITIRDHKGVKLQRNVLAFARKTVAPFEAESEALTKEWVGKIKDKLGKVGSLKLAWSTAVGIKSTVKVGAEATWDEEEGGKPEEHKCFYKAGLKVSGVVLDASAEARVSLVTQTWVPVPAYQAVARAVILTNELYRWITETDRQFFDVYAFFGVYVNISTNLSAEWKKYYQGKMNPRPGASWDLKVTGQIKTGLRMAVLAESNPNGNTVFKAEGNCQAGIEGTILKVDFAEWPPQLKYGYKVPRLRCEVFIEWDLTMFLASEEEKSDLKWYNVWGQAKKLWKDWTTKFRDKMIAAFGDAIRKGKKGFAVDFDFWDEKEVETDIKLNFLNP